MKARTKSKPPTPVEAAIGAVPAVREIVADVPGERLDVLIARACDLSRAHAHRLIEEGYVVLSLRGRPQPPEATSGLSPRVRLRPGEKLQGGETFTVTLPPPEPATPQPEAIALDIVYEDAHLIVVNKPSGMPVHPGPGHSGRTLVNALLAHCPDLPGIGGVQRPGIVHRLDKDTSGLIVAAKDDRAHHGLTAQLKAREVKKTYLALVEGRLDPPEALIDAPIGRDPNNRRRMMVIHSGRPAQTSYKVQEEFAGLPTPDQHRPGLQPGRTVATGGAGTYSLIEASPITGRTHQIRVHLASIGHPIAGDPIYGHPTPGIPRLFLHAWKLSFQHPDDGREMAFEAPLPEELAEVLGDLGRKHH